MLADNNALPPPLFDNDRDGALVNPTPKFISSISFTEPAARPATSITTTARQCQVITCM